MERYEKYKPSGIEWIGEVPEHWESFRIKYALSRSAAGVWGDDEKGDSNDIICYRIADFDYNHGCLDLDDLTTRNIEPKQLEGRIVSEGDLLIEKSGGGEATPVGRVVKVNSDQRATYTNFIHSVSVKDGYSSNYLYYYFFNLYALKINMLFFNQTTGLQNLKVGDYLSQTIFLPSLAEQEAIAAYLDARCADIDKVVATQEKRIALLKELKQSVITQAVTRGLNPDVKMKDSSVEWIGEVPEHWEIRRLKHLCEIFGRIGYRGYTEADLVSESEGAITLSPSNFSNGKLDYSKCSYLSWAKYYESPEIMIDNGDVIFVKTASVGKCALVTDLPKEATLNPQIVVFKKLKCNGPYLNYLCQTPVIQSQVTTSLNGSTIATISQEKIGSYRFALPPIEEQEQISAYIDLRCAEIDKQIDGVARQIDLLREYKQSIITEVVTGKRKVC